MNTFKKIVGIFWMVFGPLIYILFINRWGH